MYEHSELRVPGQHRAENRSRVDEMSGGGFPQSQQYGGSGDCAEDNSYLPYWLSAARAHSSAALGTVRHSPSVPGARLGTRNPGNADVMTTMVKNPGKLLSVPFRNVLEAIQ